MPATFLRLRNAPGVRYASSQASWKRPPIVQITNGTFYRRQPSGPESNETNRPLFPNINFAFPADNELNQYWAIVGPSNAGKTTFLQVLRGQHLCFPPSARTFPYLSSDEIAAKDHRLRYPANAIEYVGFDNKQKGLSGLGSYMSARYESRREATDFSLLDYLHGNIELNADPNSREQIDPTLLEQVLTDLRLLDLVQMPVSNLSNGQTRRARIARALLHRPEVLLLDEPFMGLDPPTTVQLSGLLHGMAASSNPRLLLSLRPQDPIPEWITHILFLGKDLRITHKGSKQEVGEMLLDEAEKLRALPKDQPLDDVPRLHIDFGRSLSPDGVTRDVEKLPPDQQKYYDSAKRMYDFGKRDPWILKELSREPRSTARGLRGNFIEEKRPIGEPVIEMDGVVVKYGDKAVLGGWNQEVDGELKHTDGLHWHVHRGQRWGVFGPNGSGKTTLLSLITSDHPQAYSLPVKVLGRSRLPTPGRPAISLFELQRRVGHSSPEIHGFFPRSLSVRGTLESAYADTPASRPKLNSAADQRVDAFLRWFQEELNPGLGMNEKLKEETLRRQREGKQEYTVAGLPEKWRENHNEYWYDYEAQQAASIEWADKMIFGEMPFSAQRVALFLRAIIARPDIIILDEAFSGMDDYVRDKCLLFLEAGELRRLAVYKPTWEMPATGLVSTPRGKRYTRDATFTGLNENQAVVCISHVKEEIPSCVRNWIYLPEAGTGQPCRVGEIGSKPMRADPYTWMKIWGL